MGKEAYHGNNHDLDKGRGKQFDEFLEKLEGMNLFDNSLMTCAFSENTDLVAYVLKVVTGISYRVRSSECRIPSVETQKMIKTSPDSRALYLDVFASDEDGSRYNFEIHNNPATMPPERMRLHSSMLDVGILKPGDTFSDTPSTYVIIISRKDLYGRGKPMYILNRRIMDRSGSEDYGALNDRSNIIVVNGEYRGDDEMGALMRDFSETDWKKISNESLRSAIMFYKEYHEGRAKMFDLFNKSSMDIYIDGENAGIKKGLTDGRALGLKEGFEKGEALGLEKGLEKGEALGLEKGLEKGRAEAFTESRIATAINCHKEGLPFSVIASICECSAEEVEKIIKENIGK